MTLVGFLQSQTVLTYVFFVDLMWTYMMLAFFGASGTAPRPQQQNVDRNFHTFRITHCPVSAIDMSLALFILVFLLKIADVIVLVLARYNKAPRAIMLIVSGAIVSNCLL